jgi:hypothetical protein
MSKFVDFGINFLQEVGNSNHGAGWFHSERSRWLHRTVQGAEKGAERDEEATAAAHDKGELGVDACFLIR